MNRRFMHFPDAGVSLAVEDGNGKARVTLALANRDSGDNFGRPRARVLLNARLDGDQNMLQALSAKQRVMVFPYEGTTSVNDILRPLADSLKEQLERRKKGRGNAGRIIRIFHAECKQRQIEARTSSITT